MTQAPRILCIEDNPVNWRLARRLLEQAGCEMHWAEEGLKGFEMALDLRPDLVLLDINLPGLSGFEVATKFRQQPELKDTPIIALTAKTQKIDRETALVAGCDGYIPKPIDPFTFAKQVEAYLGGRREKVDQSREGEVLRSFNAQMVEHLEIQLREAQEANRKLVTAQRELETRNQSLSRLIQMSRSLLAEHDPQTLLINVLEQLCGELNTEQIVAYRLHPSGGYWEGFQHIKNIFSAAPSLPEQHPFCQKLFGLPPSGVLHGQSLRLNRIWEEGEELQFWTIQQESALLPLRSPKDNREVRGFWAFSRPSDQLFQPLELEIISLHASLAMVGLENAELIVNLNESTRALAQSYERLEQHFQELQTAKAELSKQDRHLFMEDLFQKIAQRLSVPVQRIQTQHKELERISDNLSAEDHLGSKAIAEVKAATTQINGLLKALVRRVGGEATAIPEWLDLHEIFVQEMELLAAEGAIPAEYDVKLHLNATSSKIFGVYGDFAHLLSAMIQHGFGGPTPSSVLQITTWNEGDIFHLEAKDQSGAIPPSLLANALEPFQELHQEAILDMRNPGPGLPHCKQILSSYAGDMDIQNLESGEGEGTRVHWSVPLK